MSTLEKLLRVVAIADEILNNESLRASQAIHILKTIFFSIKTERLEDLDPDEIHGLWTTMRDDFAKQDKKHNQALEDKFDGSGSDKDQ